MQWLTRPLEYLEECAEELGTPFTLDLRHHGKYVFFADPRAVGEVLSAAPEKLVASRGNRVLRPLLGDSSLLLMEGEDHRRQRRLLGPAFQKRRVMELEEGIRECTRRAMERWPEGEEFAFRDRMQEVSLEVILEVLLGAVGEGLAEELEEVFDELLNNPRYGLALLGRMDEEGGLSEAGKIGEAFERTKSRAGELVGEVIRERRERGEGGSSVLDLLLECRDEEGGVASDEEVRDQLFTLIATGHETTATALAWAVYHVGGSEEVGRCVGKELEAEGEGPYLEAVCREVLRISPVVPVIARWVAEPVEIAGVELPAGVTASVAIHLAHRRGEVFEEPGEFRPERFLEKSYGATEYLPFGGARRRCLGANLALLEMKVVLGELYRRFEVEVVEPEKVRPVRRLVTVGPSNGVRVVVRRA